MALYWPTNIAGFQRLKRRPPVRRWIEKTTPLNPSHAKSLLMANPTNCWFAPECFENVNNRCLMKCCENGSLHSLVREAIISFAKSPIQNVLLWLWKHLLSKSLLTEASHETVELPAAASRVKYVALILSLSLLFLTPTYSSLLSSCSHFPLFFPLIEPLPLKT